jgi:hypothetical protein
MYEIVSIPPKEGKKIQCQCGYEWIYCGSSDRYATCSRCRSVVTLQPRRKKLLPEAKEQQDNKKPLRTTLKIAHPAQPPNSSDQKHPLCKGVI